MGTFLVFVSGVLFTLGIIYIMIPRTKANKVWLKVVNWLLYIVFCADLMVGVSFIYINYSFSHEKAISTAIFLFIGSAIVFGIILARLLGFLGGKSTIKEVSNNA